jgi:predicted nucleic acid-binding protein
VKHQAARSRVQALWQNESGLMSTQVLHEFYGTVTRKLSQQLLRRTAREVISACRAWPVHRPDVDDVAAASERHQLSFWDSLIIRSARRTRTASLLTEDLQDGERLTGSRSSIQSETPRWASVRRDGRAQRLPVTRSYGRCV